MAHRMLKHHQNVATHLIQADWVSRLMVFNHWDLEILIIIVWWLFMAHQIRKHLIHDDDQRNWTFGFCGCLASYLCTALKMTEKIELIHWTSPQTCRSHMHLNHAFLINVKVFDFSLWKRGFFFFSTCRSFLSVNPNHKILITPEN